jgi:hypothetical protein
LGSNSLLAALLARVGLLSASDVELASEDEVSQTSSTATGWWNWPAPWARCHDLPPPEQV